MQEEIDLIDLLRVLWKRKTLIVAGTFLVVLVGAGISFLLPNVYEVSFLLEPGKKPLVGDDGIVHGQVYVETPAAMKAAMSDGTIAGLLRKQLDFDPMPQIRVATQKNTSMVRVVVQGQHPNEIMKVVEELSRQFMLNSDRNLKVIREGYANLLRSAKGRYEMLLAGVRAVESQVAEIDAAISNIKTIREDKSSTQLAESLQDLHRNKIHHGELRERLADLNMQAMKAKTDVDNLALAVSQIEDAAIVTLPTIPEQPIRPKKALVAVMAFLGGGIGTILLAFLLEYVQRIKAVQRVTQD